MKNLNYILLLIVVTISHTAYGQHTISGTITDRESGEPIAFADVENVNNGTVAVTDYQGHFEIAAVSGEDSLRISIIGYEPLMALASNNAEMSLSASLSSIEEVVVSTSREQERRAEEPVAVSTISAQTIADNKPTTIDQVLNQTPGVYMVDLGNEQHTMSIRRPIDYGASYLYLEDGIPIRSSGIFNHNALLEINMAAVNRIEIIRGPASSFHGSEAIGGAVNFITQNPSLKPTAGVSLQGNSIGYKRTDFYASNTFGKLGVRLAGYYADQRNGTLEYSDFNKLGLSLKAMYSISDYTRLTWNTAFVDYYSDMSGSLDSADFYSRSYGSNHTFTNREVDVLRTSMKLSHYWNGKSRSTLTGYVRANSIRQNPSYRVADDFKPWIPAGDPNLAHGEVNDNSFKSYGFIAQHKQDFSWLNSNLIGGASVDYSPNTYDANYISIYKNDGGTYASFTETDSALADYSANLLNLAGFLQAKVQPVKGLNISLALRFDNFNYQFDNHLDSNAFTGVLDGKDTYSQFTPKVGVTYDFGKSRGMYVNYSKGFVPPQVTELYRGQKAPVLKPVYYNSFEFGGWLAFMDNKGRFEATLFRMDGRNEIISVLLPDGSRILQNAGETTHQGIEYNLMLEPVKGLLFRVSGTNALHKFTEYVENGTDFENKSMPQAPGWIGNMQVTYKPAFFEGFRISMEWQHINEYYMDAANDKSYEGYDVFNLRLGYKWKDFEVWTNVLNLTNQLYATVARANQWGQTYSLGNPRSFNVGIGYNFKQK